MSNFSKYNQGLALNRAKDKLENLLDDGTTHQIKVLAGDVTSAVILHVPHAGLAMPADALTSILLDELSLNQEIELMADLETDMLACAAYDIAAAKPHVFINQFSRLTIDPERFPDDREEMNAVGMGAVYTRTSAQAPLRETDSARDQKLIHSYFHPYAQMFQELVDSVLEIHGEAIILDLHSFGTHALPYELHKHEARPQLCIGADNFHTSADLINNVSSAFDWMSDIKINEPFHGTYVPLKHYGHDPRVQSVMLEIRKDTYLDSPTRQQVIESISRLV